MDSFGFTKSLQLMIRYLLSIFFFSLVYTTNGQDLTAAHQDSLKTVVQRYYELSLKIYQPGSAPADVEDLFDLFTDDFVYVHPKYGGSYSRQDLYEGYLRNLSNGAYDGSIVDLRLKNLIAGLNAVATERAYVQKRADGTLIEVDPGMTLFEFRDGKISRIFEYW